jgi:hypothetical protein
MASPETLYTRNVINELSFPPVTHMIYFDIRFGRYRFLNSDFHTDQVLDTGYTGAWSGFWATR